MHFMRSVRRVWFVAAVLLPASCGRTGEARREFDQAAMESRAMQAQPVLKQAFVLQQSHRDWKGRYAATFDELKEVGWEEPAGLEFYDPPRVVRADDEGFCIVMEPRRDGLWPQHVDQAGSVVRGPCP